MGFENRLGWRIPAWLAVAEMRGHHAQEHAFALRVGGYLILKALDVRLHSPSGSFPHLNHRAAGCDVVGVLEQLRNMLVDGVMLGE
ncbi:MAG: hypothetical protein E4G93_04890 [Dehalococcoidia bacterium]|nr:MAG: hypothetical protein E4G93_04890 [Dehalococcoidia bacterium]